MQPYVTVCVNKVSCCVTPPRRMCNWYRENKQQMDAQEKEEEGVRKKGNERDRERERENPEPLGFILLWSAL